MRVSFCILVLLVSMPAFAKDDLIEKGFKAYKDGGAKLAWPVFAKNGPMEGSKELVGQAMQFSQIEAYYGSYVNHEYVSEKVLGKNNKMVYVLLNLESGSMFGKFHLYKKADGTWITPNFNLHTHVEQIWPTQLYSDCSQ